MNVGAIGGPVCATPAQAMTSINKPTQAEAAAAPRQPDSCNFSLSARICLSVHDKKKHERDLSIELSVSVQAIQQCVQQCPALQSAGGMVGVTGVAAGGMGMMG